MALDRNRLLKPVKKLRKLISRIHNDAAPEQVHNLRTASRRFERGSKRRLAVRRLWTCSERRRCESG